MYLAFVHDLENHSVLTANDRQQQLSCIGGHENVHPGADRWLSIQGMGLRDAMYTDVRIFVLSRKILSLCIERVL